MDLDTDNKILQTAAQGGSIDYALWPDLLSRLIPRLEQIVHNEFPTPSLPHLSSSHPLSSPPQIQSQTERPSLSQTSSDQNTAGSSQSADKENAPPTFLQSNPPNVHVPPGTLPPHILSLLNSITQTLTTYFSQYPPHTIQRLSELILTPKHHYRTLNSYLHALDRVVHVTSGANIYPLPAAVQDSKALPNGTSSGTDINLISWGTTTQTIPTLGSDESLGGALLTPIPWIRHQTTANNSNGNSHIKELEGEVKTESTETIDGPNGAGRIETVSVSVNGIPSTTLASTSNNGGGFRAEGGVTQGELLRQEQHAGVVPITQLASTRESQDGDVVKNEDDAPHARGPEEIGMQDMGPQAAGTVGHGIRRIDVEAAVGRRSEGSEEGKNEEAPLPTTPKRGADEEMENESKRMKEELPNYNEQEQDEDEKMLLVDAGGKAEGEAKVGEVGDNVGAHAIDTSIV